MVNMKNAQLESTKTNVQHEHCATLQTEPIRARRAESLSQTEVLNRLIALGCNQAVIKQAVIEQAVINLNM